MMTNELSVKPGACFHAIAGPAHRPLGGRIVAQPSKNYTTRYLLAAALAEGESIVRNCATSADSIALQHCLSQLGAIVEVLPESANNVGQDFRVTGVAGRPQLADSGPINPGNAGAVLRFLLAVGALLPEVTFVTDHPKSLGTRPNADLLQALQQLGCDSEPASGLLPITLHGGNLRGGDVSISGARSSQFLSGLLFLAPMVGEEVRIQVVESLVSRAPVRQTIEVLKATGVAIDAADDLRKFTVVPSMYHRGTFRVNGDWPGSAALLAAVAVAGGEINIAELRDDEQGEKATGLVLASMGADFQFNKDGTGVSLKSDGRLTATEFDGDHATDAVLALMGAACFARGRTRIYNVSNLRIKECDRISEPIAELRKIGVKCWEGSELGDPDPDAIIIEGNPDGYAGGVTVDGRDDHRVIMLLSIVALRCQEPLRILRAHQIAKSYPEFFSHLASIGADISFEKATT